MSTVIEAFVLVFMAELGDKSMLLAMTFATRYPLPPVLAGIFLGILANHGLAVLVGSQAGRLLPTALIHPLSGVLFLLFAFMSLRGAEEEAQSTQRSGYVWLACALTFFAGEFGDKTQITAMTLASSEPALRVLLGTVTAMMCTSLLSIWVGSRIGQKIPERMMRVLSGGVFLIVGLIRLRGSLPAPVYAAAAMAAVLAYAVMVRRARAGDAAPGELQIRAEALKRQQELLEKATLRMCLGQQNCGTCAGAACMVGYAKRLFQINEQEELAADVTGLIRKEYPPQTVRDGLNLILHYFETYGWDDNPDSPQHRLRGVFEVILFGERIDAGSISEYLPRLRAIDPKGDWRDWQNTP